MLSVLPEVAKEKSLALHGGTAINLFIREMPRLSVDIDLTYTRLDSRESALLGIRTALGGIKARIEKILRDVRVIDRSDKGKLQISNSRSTVKLEVNLIGRGTIGEPKEMPLVLKAQEEFEVFCSMPIVPFEQLFGGKICAGLDRQHPLDIFDVKYLLENEGFTPKIKEGFFLCLLGSDRPTHELIDPNLQDQRRTLENHFDGMSYESFGYDEFETVRRQLVTTIHKSITHEDAEFLLRFTNVEPDWSLYNFSAFPAIIWKLQNLKRLKDTNPAKHSQQYQILSAMLASFKMSS